METFRLAVPWALAAWLLVPALLAWRRWRGRSPVWLVPYVAAWLPRGERPRGRWRIVLAYVALALLVIAAARPQRVDAERVPVTRGADLVLAVDLSTSMLAEDYAGPDGPINRLEALRPVLQRFVRSRPNDRIALVVFAGKAYTLAPLTTDHRGLERAIAELQIGSIDDGTAVGDGLGIALSQFRRVREGAAAATDAPGSRFVVLLTDGANTSGTLSPPQATAIARHRAVPVYTIAAGRNGLVPFPVFDAAGRRTGTSPQPSSVDIAALRTIAAATGGRHFDATDAAALAAAFADIDAAEKSVVQFRTQLVVRELLPWFVVPALVLLLVASPALRALGATAAFAQVRRGRVAGGRVRFGEGDAHVPGRPWRLAAAVACAVVALSWPFWGEVERRSVESAGEIVLALDLSRSMLAPDLAPQRLDHARRVATALADRLAEYRLGLVGFAGSAAVLAAPSRDHALLREYLGALEPRHFVEQGSDFAEMLDVAMGAFGEGAAWRTLVVLSDGEADSTAWRDRLPELRRRGVRVVGVGFGSSRGAPVPGVEERWLRDARGLFVRSDLDMGTLGQLGEGTEGAAFDAANTRELVRELVAATVRDDRRAEAAAADGAFDALPWLTTAVLLLLAWSLAVEWPARARLARGGAALAAAAWAAVVTAAGLGFGSPADVAAAAAGSTPRTARPISREERESLDAVKAAVAAALERAEPSADDYLAVARAAADYGLVHRAHAHPIAEGVLRDGLAAVSRGRELRPETREWEELRARLQRLLVPPPPVPPDGTPPDPANEAVDARQDVPVPGDAAQQDEEGEAADAGDAERLRNVGGGQADLYDSDEWRDPTVVLPLYLLEKIRGTDSPAELFLVRQQKRGDVPRSSPAW